MNSSILDNLRTIDDGGLKTYFPPADESSLPNARLRLTGGKRAAIREARRRMVELKRHATAKEQLGALPRKGEGVFLLLDGRFALFHLLIAVIELAGDPVDHLLVATLGLSKLNAQHFDRLLADGTIRRMDLLVSHFFAAQDKPIWEYAGGVLGQHQNCRAVAMRSHAKLFCAKIGKRHIVCTSSANLRSCVNVEQATIHDSRELYEFFRRGLEPLFTKGATNG